MTEKSIRTYPSIAIRAHVCDMHELLCLAFTRNAINIPKNRVFDIHEMRMVKQIFFSFDE